MPPRWAAGREEGPELSSFRGLYDFAFDDFQVRACQALAGGHGVLVAAPTGAGKTVVGEFAVHLALAQGGKCFYTTPIKALSNQKYADLARRYGAASVGLLTGDNSINGDAPVVVMTTEVLRNMLYAGSPTLDGLGYVVMDEVHYLADRFRGAVWEEVIIHLPESVQLVALSATVSNAEEFGDWLAEVRGGTTVIVDEHRPVPLWQHMLVGGRLFDLFTADQDGPAGPAGAARAARAMVNPELLRLARRDLGPGRAGPGRGSGRGPHARGGRGGRPPRYRGPNRPEVIDRLDRAGLLPAITFIFSRAGCDAAVQQCLDAGLRLTTPEEAAEITELAPAGHGRHRVRRPAGARLLGVAARPGARHRRPPRRPAARVQGGRRGAVHGGLVRAVFATETLALGINMPARSVVLERLVKFNGEAHADLTPGEYTQLTGRAGRRGIDVEGHAVVLWQPGIDPGRWPGWPPPAPTRCAPASGRPTTWPSTWSARSAGPRAAELLESSFAQFQADRAVVGLARQVRRSRDELAAAAVHCDAGDFGSTRRCAGS